MIVVDASVAVKWTVIEPGRDAALRLIDRADELVAPDLLIAEAANVFRKKSRLGEITVSQSEEALRAIQLVIPRFIASSHLAEDALALSRNLDHSVYDCFYLACALPAARLVTADDKFISKCRSHGLGSFVSPPGDIEVQTDSVSIDSLRLKIGIIDRLSAQMEKTFESLRAAGDSSSIQDQPRFIPTEVYRPVFDSPAYRRLLTEIDRLDDDELATLVALGWLGRPYHDAEEWGSLLTNARRMVGHERPAYGRYFVAQMSSVTDGLAKLRASRTLSPQ